MKAVDIYIVFYFTKFPTCYIHLCNISEKGSKKCNVILTFYEKPKA